MSLAASVKRLEAHLADELDAQGALLEAVDGQERAVRGGDREELVRWTSRYETLLRDAARRERERRAVLEEFAGFFGVEARTLTLGSLAERLGPHAGALPTLRKRLRAAVTDVLRSSRKLLSVARFHRGIVEEVLTLMAPESEGADQDGRGALLRVEA